MRPRADRLFTEARRMDDELLDQDDPDDEVVDRLCDLTAALSRWVEDDKG